MEKEFRGKKYEFEEISYGEFMDCLDDATIVDAFTGKERLKQGKFIHELTKLMVKHEGKPVDTYDRKICSVEVGKWLDSEINSMISVVQAKNQSGESGKDSQSLATGKKS